MRKRFTLSPEATVPDSEDGAGYLILEIGAEQNAHLIFDGLDEDGKNDEYVLLSLPFTQLPRVVNVLQRAVTQFTYLCYPGSEEP
jgi:hypothetical protein